MSRSRECFDAARECRDPAERDAAGFRTSQVKSWSDFTARCPVIERQMLVADQAEHPPFGATCFPIGANETRRHGESLRCRYDAVAPADQCEAMKRRITPTAGEWKG